MKLITPHDGWGFKDGLPIIPRKWQAAALPVIVNYYNQENPQRAVVYAITGSGKSVLIAALCACIQCDDDEIIVVSTSRQKLVKQIRETIKDRLEADDFLAQEQVGAFYADAKQIRKVTVCCNDSMGNLAEALSRIGKRCGYWICDELHHSQNRTMLEAASALMAPYAIGFSATPFRANEKQGISSFDTVIVKYGVHEALNDKCIVPWEVRGWEGAETDLDSACIEMMKACGKRGIVNAVSIDDAVLFSQKCTDSGYAVEAVHSKQSDAENDRIINDMRTGKIQAICHVDLMTEGVNIEEILHLTMRRVVGSRVRFCQELGRGVRSFTDPMTGEEKTRLICNDPSDLFGVFRLNYEAVLSGDFDADDPDATENEPEGKRLERSLQQECFACLRHLVQVKAGKLPFNAGPLGSYLSQLVSVFDTFGLIDRKITSRDWRREPASEKQVTAMQNLKWTLKRKQVPDLHQNALELLTGHGTRMTRGMSSDLISIQQSLAEKSTWPKFSQLDQIVAEGLEKHRKKAAGGVAKPSTPLRAKSAAPPPVVQGLLFGDLGATKK